MHYSIYCGEDAQCGHTGVVCEKILSIVGVKLTSSLLSSSSSSSPDASLCSRSNRSSYSRSDDDDEEMAHHDTPRRDDEMTGVHTLSHSLSEQLLSSSQCQVVMIFATCTDLCSSPSGACSESLHVIQVSAIDGVLTRMQATMLTNPWALCSHGRNTFVTLAHEQGKYFISNELATDPRTPYRKMPVAHFPVESVFVAPLYVRTKCFGYVAFLNARSVSASGACPGFTVNMCDELLPLLHTTAIELMQMQLELTVQQMQATINHMDSVHREEISRAALSRDTFIAMMSHEIRTPLHTVNGYNEILMSTSHGNDSNSVVVRQCLRKQRDAILQLTQLIANILDFSKLRSNNLSLDAREFDLRECVEKALDMGTLDCQRKNIELKLMYNENVPKSFVGDSTRIYQIISNLILNAIKYTSSGFVYVRVGLYEGTEHDNAILISVEDTGSGVPVEIHDRIFEGYQQFGEAIPAGSSSSSASATHDVASALKGVGLGLAICRGLIELMGGRIWVESDGYSGSKFSCIIPLLESASVNKLIASAQTNFGEASVLVVDDLEVNRMLFSKMFVEWGLRPHVCSSLEEAIHTLKMFPENYFRAAIIDMDIAGESGLTLVRFVLQSDNVARYSSMILVAASSIGNVFTGSDEFDAVHVKPIMPNNLLEDIVRLSSRESVSQRQKERMQRTRKTHAAVDGRRRMNLRRSRTLTPVDTDVHEDSDNGVRVVEDIVLIVDDYEPSIVVLEQMLVSLGVDHSRILSASSAERALALLDTYRGRVKCVFMDVIMPTMNGIECTRRIHSNIERFGSPVVVALTADAVDKTKLKMTAAGAVEFISKPVFLDDLRRVVNKYYFCQKKKNSRRQSSESESVKRRVKKRSRRKTTTW